MSPKRKGQLNFVLTVLTGEVSTAIFRACMTCVGVICLTAASKVNDIYHLPERQAAAVEEQRIAVKQLQTTIDESIIKLREAEETARKELVSKTQLLQQMNDWEKERDALSKMVESHERALSVQSGKLDNILRVQEKILSMLMPDKK